MKNYSKKIFLIILLLNPINNNLKANNLLKIGIVYIALGVTSGISGIILQVGCNNGEISNCDPAKITGYASIPFLAVGSTAICAALRRKAQVQNPHFEPSNSEI